MSTGSDGDHRKRTGQGRADAGRGSRREVRSERTGVQRRAGVATSRLRQRVEEDKHEEGEQRHDELPRVLRRRQGVTTATVLHLEYYRRYGEPIDG